MAKRVYVTTAQQTAAQLLVERNEAKGREIKPAIAKIANATSPRSGEQLAAKSA